MRYNAKVDANQPVLVEALRKHGCGVQSLAQIGKGCPDLLVCSPDGRRLALAEVKLPKHDLNEMQQEWHARWRGPVTILRTLDDVQALVESFNEQA